MPCCYRLACTWSPNQTTIAAATSSGIDDALLAQTLVTLQQLVAQLAAKEMRHGVLCVL
jgi:hypothetical protein